MKDGEALVEKIRRSGKTLNKIVITSGDPDFYFGLQPLVKAFPNAKVVATQQVVDHIKATKDAKLAFWGPQMKDGAPTTLVVPQVLASTTFMVDGEKIDIEQPDSYAAYVWIPSAKTILGNFRCLTGYSRLDGRYPDACSPPAVAANPSTIWLRTNLNA